MFIIISDTDATCNFLVSMCYTQLFNLLCDKADDVNLEKIRIFYTDRGNEFKNRILDEALDTFRIRLSLSMKGGPYDNAVAEATFKIIKTEFVTVTIRIIGLCQLV